MTDTYDLGQAARFLGRDLESVMRLVESGQLPSTQAGPDGDVAHIWPEPCPLRHRHIPAIHHPEP